MEEQPPVIDIEPEGSAKSRVGTAIGCILGAIPVATVLLAVAIAGLGVAFFILGGDKTKEAAAALNAEETPAGGTAPQPKAVTKAPTAVAVNRGETLKGPSTQSQVKTTTRGTTNYMVAKGSFVGSGSKLTYEVVYQAYGDGIGYRCFLLPYDSRVNRMFEANRGKLALSFLDSTGNPLLPATGSLSIPLSEMTAYENQGAPAGWIGQGVVPLNGVSISDIQSVKLGWRFEEELNTLLQQVARE